MLFRQYDALRAVAGFRDNLQTFFHFNQLLNAVPQQRMIVNQQDSGGFFFHAWIFHSQRAANDSRLAS